MNEDEKKLYNIPISYRKMENLHIVFWIFKDRDNLCLVMDLMTGGDLRYHIGRNKRFSEEQTSTLK
jgi:serine/threonine protein kinase